MKKIGLVSILGLFLIAFQQLCFADACTQISNLLEGEWQFDKANKSDTLKFERNKTSMIVYGVQVDMSSCIAIPNYSVSFIVNGHFMIIYLPKQQQTSIKLVTGFKNYNLTRQVSAGTTPEPSALETKPLENDVKTRVFILPSQKYREQFLLMKNSGQISALENLAKSADANLIIVAKECGVINAWYSPQEKSITLCYEYLDSAEKFIDSTYQKEPLETQATLQTGIFMSVLMHELGHALIDLRMIPIIGGQEDAADRIATIFLLEFTEKNPIQGKAMIIGDLAYKWATQRGQFDTNLFSDEHPITEQRAFNIMCLAYGSNPNLFADTASQLGLTKQRALRCENEYLAAKSAVQQLVKWH